MKRLRKVLQSNVFYYLLFIFLLIYCIVIIRIHDKKNVVKPSGNSFEGIVTNYKRTDKGISFVLKSNNKYQVNYYSEEAKKENICFGCKVKVKGTVSEASNNTVPYAFNYKKYLKNNDIYYVIKAANIGIDDSEVGFINKIKNLINNRINVIDNNGYLRAFIVGDKSELEEYDIYQDLGISHLFCVSGMHIGIFCAFLLVLFKKINVKIRYLIVDLLLIGYGGVIGYTPSILRCIIFFVLNSLNKIFKLDISNIKIFLITIFIILMFNPLLTFNIGFQFSLATVLGIIYAGDYINGGWFSKCLKCSLVAFLFSSPIALLNFYSINILSIIYNLFFIPYISLIVYPLSLISFICPFFYKLFAFFINNMIWISNIIKGIDFGKIRMSLNIYEVLIIYVFLLLFLRKRMKKYLILVGMVVIFKFLYPYFDSSAYVYFFDVGQGDSALVIYPFRKKVILIDTGGNANSDYSVLDNVLKAFYYLGINKIDYYISTHGDYDHMGESIHLVNNFKVEKVIFNCGTYNDLEQELIRVLDKKKIKYYSCIKELNIDKNKLYFLQTKEYDNENDNSNVIYTELNGYKFMFMGDASITTEKEILNKYNLSNIDVLKVGHHGSKTSSSRKFINKIKPKYSIISVGKYNRYGHPNKEVLKVLEDSKMYRTDQDGSIMFKIKDNRLKIENCNP